MLRIALVDILLFALPFVLYAAYMVAVKGTAPSSLWQGAPVFWLFFLLTGFALFVLRRREPQVQRPFRVPLFPITPIAFCLAAAYLLYSSLDYVRRGAVAGLIVLASGVLVMLVAKTKRQA